VCVLLQVGVQLGDRGQLKDEIEMYRKASDIYADGLSHAQSVRTSQRVHSALSNATL